MFTPITNLKTSWFLFFVAIIFAVLNQILLACFVGGVSQYYRDLIDDKKPSLEKLISFHIIWKWFSVVYYITASALSLYYMTELKNIGAAQFVLLIMFPIIPPWFRYDYLLFKKMQNA